MRKRAFAVGGALAALMVVTAGCAQDQPPRPVAAASAGIRPLTDVEQLRIADAQQRLIGSCMTRQGFKFWEAERLSLEESRTVGYVQDDVDWAREHGYGSRIQAKEDRARQANPNLAYRASLSPQRRAAYDKALDGGLDAPVISAGLPGGGTIRKKVGGCAAESEKRLYGDLTTWFRADKVAANLRPLYVPQVLRDDEFKAALNAWARCMERAGHSYADPAAARRAAAMLPDAGTSEKSFATEREIATAEATCARTASLKTVGAERERFHVDALRDRYGEAIDTSRRIQHEAFARAAELVGPRT
ncbi:hypothetical protein [Streptomyces sp. NPDC058579]|uniref:hypothetical protein n=1 Tax=Streptomyces sp. NPDC058579 TaxID=3346548 RepID=UPI0036680D82